VAIDFFESFKRELFITEDAVVVELVSRLLRVKLILKHIYLVGEGLQLVEKGALWNGGSFFRIFIDLSVTFLGTITEITDSLCLCL